MNKILKSFYFYIIVIIGTLIIFTQNISDYLRFDLFFKNDLLITLSTINPQIKEITLDSENLLLLTAEVKNNSGDPVSNVPINLSSSNTGTKILQTARTDKKGTAILKYSPPDNKIIGDSIDKNKVSVFLKATIAKTQASTTIEIKLRRIPVILIHGYQETASIYDNMKEFLSSKNFDCKVLSYKSENGVIEGSKKLDYFLKEQQEAYLKSRIQVKRFNVIAHSMGGLVVRYYSANKDYISKNNIKKVIFISVPHKGSYWAKLGSQIYNDQGITDLSPDNPLLSHLLPRMMNNGLNKSIQAGSILAQYDEVVTEESASLEEWGIDTILFNVGENNLTIENLFNGKLLKASNHKNILFNNRIFNKIQEMLKIDLPFPVDKNSET